MKATIKFDGMWTLLDFMAKHNKEAQFCKLKRGKAVIEVIQYESGNVYGTKTEPLNDLPDEEAKALFLQMIEAAPKAKGFISIKTTK